MLQKIELLSVRRIAEWVSVTVVTIVERAEFDLNLFA